MTATRDLRIDLRIDTSRFREGMNRMAEAMRRFGASSRSAGVAASRLAARMAILAEERKLQAEALRRWTASPQFSRPQPCSVDGHEYHRRRKARQRRKRNR